MLQKIKIKKLAVLLHAWSQDQNQSAISLMSKTLADIFYKKGNSRALRELVRELERLDEKKSGLVRVALKSAWPLNSSSKEKILRQLKIEKFIVTEAIDQSLLGGVEIRFNDKIINTTLKKQLQHLSYV